jgi:hypothetical protein
LAISALAEGHQAGAFQPLDLPGWVITIAGFDLVASSIFSVPHRVVRSIRCVTNIVLIAQLVFQLRLNGRDGLGAGYFEKGAARLMRQSLHRLLTVRAGKNAFVSMVVGE